MENKLTDTEEALVGLYWDLYKSDFSMEKIIALMNWRDIKPITIIQSEETSKIKLELLKAIIEEEYRVKEREVKNAEQNNRDRGSYGPYSVQHSETGDPVSRDNTNG